MEFDHHFLTKNNLANNSKVDHVRCLASSSVMKLGELDYFVCILKDLTPPPPPNNSINPLAQMSHVLPLLLYIKSMLLLSSLEGRKFFHRTYANLSWKCDPNLSRRKMWSVFSVIKYQQYASNLVSTNSPYFMVLPCLMEGNSLLNQGKAELRNKVGGFNLSRPCICQSVLALSS